MAATYLIEKPMGLLNVIGFHPCYQGVWAKVRASIMTVLIAFLVGEILAEVILKYNGLESIQPLAFSISMQQMLYRCITMTTQRAKFVKLMSCMEKLNHLTNFKELSKMRIGLLSKYDIICRKCISIFVWLLNGIGIVIFFVVPVIVKSQLLYLPLYHNTHRTPYYEIISASLCLLSCTMGSFLTVPFEFLYASLIIYFICEIKVLKAGFKSLASDDTPCTGNVKFLVGRHNLILKCIEYINNIYSALFLNQFFSSAMCICGCLISIIADDLSAWSRITHNLGLISICLGQLFILCLGGTLLTEECESIATAAYECEWWRKTQPELRRSLVLVIQRSRRSKMLVAGGIIPMNLTSFTSVIEGVYSFYSLLQTIYKH